MSSVLCLHDELTVPGSTTVKPATLFCRHLLNQKQYNHFQTNWWCHSVVLISSLNALHACDYPVSAVQGTVLERTMLGLVSRLCGYDLSSLASPAIECPGSLTPHYTIATCNSICYLCFADFFFFSRFCSPTFLIPLTTSSVMCPSFHCLYVYVLIFQIAKKSSHVPHSVR